MAAILGITDAGRRIGEIQARIASRASRVGDQPAPIDGSGPVEPTAGFDPFGAAYQQALTAADVGQPLVPSGSGPSVASSSATGPSGWSSASVLRVDSLDLTRATRRVTSASSASTSTGRTTGQVGGYGPMPVPAELAAFGNGEIPASSLESIGQGGHRLAAPAAQAWKQAVAAATADGIDLTVTDSYRSYDEQVDLANRKGLYADGGLAAVPGTSNHGWGLAVDANVDDAAALRWLQANGHRFGFVEAVPREPWHWEFRPGQA